MDITIDTLTAEQVKQFNPALFKMIQESTDPDERIKALEDKAKVEAAAKKELSESSDKLKAEVEGLKKENGELKGKNDKYEAEKALAEKKETINTLLTEAKLPKEIVTDYFKESLLDLDKEAIEKAIEDRKKIAESHKGRVIESGDEFTGEDKAKKEANEADKEEILDSVRQ